jgi:hypothetical protein
MKTQNPAYTKKHGHKRHADNDKAAIIGFSPALR